LEDVWKGYTCLYFTYLDTLLFLIIRYILRKSISLIFFIVLFSCKKDEVKSLGSGYLNVIQSYCKYDRSKFIIPSKIEIDKVGNENEKLDLTDANVHNLVEGSYL